MDDHIGFYKIDVSICDRLVKAIDSNRLIKDRQRGYSRLNSMKLYKQDPELYDDYRNEILRCRKLYHEKYRFSNHKGLEMSADWNLQKYEPGECYKNWHPEMGRVEIGRPVRYLVFMTYLNTVRRGGGTSFKWQEKTFRPVKGRTLIWPAWFTHTHRGEVAPDECKYIATGWFEQEIDLTK